MNNPKCVLDTNCYLNKYLMIDICMLRMTKYIQKQFAIHILIYNLLRIEYNLRLQNMECIRKTRQKITF